MYFVDMFMDNILIYKLVISFCFNWVKYIWEVCVFELVRNIIVVKIFDIKFNSYILFF